MSSSGCHRTTSSPSRIRCWKNVSVICPSSTRGGSSASSRSATSSRFSAMPTAVRSIRWKRGSLQKEKSNPMSPIGTAAQPLRVAIVGAGPAGFYAAERLFKESEMVVEVDMYDRLPTPFGLVRNGVAPDHQKIKSVTAAFDRIAGNPRFRFFGNVELGRDLSV